MSKFQPTRASVASVIGTTIEYYDFFVYATAATLVFTKVFFPALHGLAGTLVSLSTFAVAFFVRPIGGIVIGHLGDKLGRRPMLVLTLVLMGGATLLIGLLPGYTVLGVAAPILLILLRVVQGFAMGGEFSGAVVLTMEHSGTDRRGFFGGIVQVGGPLGLVLATLVFVPLYSLPEDALLSWGWRIPFLLSVALIIVGYLLRRTTHESPAFSDIKAQGAVDRVPTLTVLRSYLGRTVLVAASTLSGGVVFYMLAVFGLAYGAEAPGVGENTMLLIVMSSMVIDSVFVFIAGAVSDKIGRGTLKVFGEAGIIVVIFPWIFLTSSGNPWLIFLGYVLVCVPHSALQGVNGVFLSEVYPARVRFSGLSIGYTVGMIAGSSVAPMIAEALNADFGVYSVGFYVLAMSALALPSVLGLIRIRRQMSAVVADEVPSAVPA